MASTSSLSPCIVLFDGVCDFCDGFVQFLARCDPAMRCRIAASQSPAGKLLMERHGLTETDVTESLFLVEQGSVASRSTAVLRIASRMTFPWRLLGTLRLVPRPLRDGVYRIVSANRYRWFGRKESCRLPTPEERARFLQSAEDLARFDAEHPPPLPGL